MFYMTVGPESRNPGTQEPSADVFVTDVVTAMKTVSHIHEDGWVQMNTRMHMNTHT